MATIKQAVILAGGQGTRLRPLTDKIPKPMILMNKKPFLEYLIELLKDNGISEIVLLLGYLPEKIVEYFGNGSKYGLNIKYSIGDISFETGTRIKNAGILLDDYFLLMYCDNYWPINLKLLLENYNKHETLGQVTIYSNKDRITRNNIHVDNDGYVIKYDRSRKETDLNGVEIGFFILNKNILKLMPDHNFSFEDEIIPQLINNRELRGYITDHRYYSTGKLERLPVTEKYLQPKRVIFLDRDGVINKKAPKADYVKNWTEFEFLPGAIEAIRILNRNNFKVYIVSNQAGIARGLMSESDLDDIHENMKKELLKHDATIDGIYYCPHGWNDECNCRKPKPGMFFQAAGEHHIDLGKTIFIGDDERDIEAGEAAGIRTLLVTPENDILSIVKDLLIPDREKRAGFGEICKSILSAYSSSNKKRFFVLIGGCSRSGKTDLAQKLQAVIKRNNINCLIVCLDNWLKGIDERDGSETVRERYNYNKIIKDIEDLRKGIKIHPPVYNPMTRMVTKNNENQIFIDEGICIIDGAVALDIDELRLLSDFNIFVDIPDDLRKKRLMQFYSDYKKCSRDECEKIITSREIDEVPIIKKTRSYADIIYDPGIEQV